MSDNIVTPNLYKHTVAQIFTMANRFVENNHNITIGVAAKMIIGNMSDPVHQTKAAVLLLDGINIMDLIDFGRTYSPEKNQNKKSLKQHKVFKQLIENYDEHLPNVIADYNHILKGNIPESYMAAIRLEALKGAAGEWGDQREKMIKTLG